MKYNTNNNKVVKRCFKDFVSILDLKSDYYILNYYVNEEKRKRNEMGVNEDNNDNNDNKK